MSYRRLIRNRVYAAIILVGTVIVLTACAPSDGADSQGAGGGGSIGRGAATPNAMNDLSTTTLNTSVNIDVVRNDQGLADGPIVTSIFSNPSNGSVSVLNDGSIGYLPAIDFAGDDSFVYVITDADGDLATATVSVSVTCDRCAVSTLMSVSWDQNTDNILGYELYFAKSNVATDAVYLLESVAISSDGFEPSSPSVVYDAWNDLGLYKGDSVCFRVKAYNIVGSSGYSPGVCSTL